MNEILCSNKKECDLVICDNMDEFRGYDAKWNKSGGERKTLYGFTYMWILKKTETKQN